MTIIHWNIIVTVAAITIIVGILIIVIIALVRCHKMVAHVSQWIRFKIKIKITACINAILIIIIVIIILVIIIIIIIIIIVIIIIIIIIVEIAAGVIWPTIRCICFVLLSYNINLFRLWINIHAHYIVGTSAIPPQNLWQGRIRWYMCLYINGSIYTMNIQCIRMIGILTLGHFVGNIHNFTVNFTRCPICCIYCPILHQGACTFFHCYLNFMFSQLILCVFQWQNILRLCLHV